MRMATTSAGEMATAPIPMATTTAAMRTTARTTSRSPRAVYGASSGCSSSARSAMAWPVRGPKPMR